VSDQLPSETVSGQYEPPAKAMQAAEPIVRAIWDSNGNPKTMTLDEQQVQRIAAFAIDAVVSAIRGDQW
jgi:hypothetical protein